jgi:hypothetical protein
VGRTGRDDHDDGHRRPRPKPPLPQHQPRDAGEGLSQAGLVEALRAIEREDLLRRVRKHDRRAVRR